MNRAQLREAVLERDGGCVLAKIEPLHVCRDMFGNPHGPYALSLLTVEHVRPQAAMGAPRVHEPRWCVALCAFYNGPNVVTADQKEAFRAYLARVSA